MTTPWDADFINDVEWSLKHGQVNQRLTVEELARAERLMMDKKVDALLSGVDSNGTTSSELGHLASTVEIEPIRWLWRGRLALGMLSGLDGDPDLGKSQVVAYEAATITTGREWMDGCPCPKGGVVLVSAEDSDSSVLVPRLMAAGADLERILILSTVPDEDAKPRLISLPKDIPLLREAIKQVEALLIVFDPITSYISIKLNANADQPVRQALTPLAEMLDEVGCAGQMLRHHSKDNKVSNALYRGLGSIAFNALARTAMQVAKDKEQQDSYILTSIKANIGKKPKARRYAIEGVNVGAGVEASHIIWGEETDHQAEELTTAFGAREKKQRTGEELLTSLLSNGPRDSEEIFEAFAQAGISRATAFNYKKKMGIKARKKGFDDGWEWLPLDPSKSLSEPENPEESSSNGEESTTHFLDSSTLRDSPRVEESKSLGVRAHARKAPSVEIVQDRYGNKGVVLG